MSFRDFVEEASNFVRESCLSLGYTPPASIEWDIPPTKDLGDVSFRIGYQLSKTVRKRPAEIASEIASRIEADFANKKRLVRVAEGHPSGFLNFRFNNQKLFSAVLTNAQKEDYGAIDLGNGKRLLVEHTSVNPNKALHIGHLRNVAVGDSISRIFGFTNHEVRVLNYIDDSGLQVADVIVGLLFLGYPKEPPTAKKYDHYAGDDIYVGVNRKYESDPSIAENRRHVLKAIELHDEKIFPLASEITTRVLREQMRTCWRFNAFYDLFVFESDIIASKLWEDLFEALKTKGIARLETSGKLSGCWIVKVKGEREGEDKVLVRSDGTATYVAKDTPFAALKVGLAKDKFSYEKFEELQPNGHPIWRTNVSGDSRSPVLWGSESITVIDSRQAKLQRVIGHILEQLSAGKELQNEYIYLGYSIVSLSPRTAASLHVSESDSVENDVDEEERVVTMSGRKGTYINADDLFDLVHAKALEETKKRNESISDQNWLSNIAEKIAIAAIRFSLLKQDLDKMIIFDLEESLKLVGETGPYMLYSYARAMSILSRVNPTDLSKSQPHGEVLATETENDLMTILSKYDIAVEKSVKMLAPKWIAHYSFELSESFNKFYEKNRVLQVEEPLLRSARIGLVSAFANVLKSALGLLGIEVLPKI